MSTAAKAVVLTLTCVVLWSFIPVVSKLGQSNLDNYQFLFCSSVLSFLVVGMTTFLAKRAHCFNRYTKTEILHVAFLAFLGTFFYYLLLYYGYAQGMEVLILQYTWPVLIVLFSLVFLKEKLNLTLAISMILGFSAMSLVITKGDFSNVHLSNLTTNLAVVLGASAFALFSVLSKKVNFEAYTYTTLLFLFASLFSTVSLFVFSGFVLPDLDSLPSVLMNGAFINGLSYILWAQALSYADASKLSPFIFFTPVISTLLIVLIFDEPFLAVYGVSLVMVIAAGLITAIRK